MAPCRREFRGHLRRIRAPEKLVTERERRNAEYAARDRLVGVPAQLVLDRGQRDALARVGHSKRRGELRPLDRQVGEPAVAPDETEDAVHRLRRRIARDGEPQQRQRIEWMLRRELERNGEPPCLPQAETVGERPLGGDLGRAFLPMRAEQAGEQDRLVPNRDPWRERSELLALQIGERRNEIEIPVGDHPALNGLGATSASGSLRRPCATRRERRPHRELRRIVKDAPGGDLVQRAKASRAHTRDRIEDADADARRRDAFAGVPRMLSGILAQDPPTLAAFGRCAAPCGRTTRPCAREARGRCASAAAARARSADSPARAGVLGRPGGAHADCGSGDFAASARATRDTGGRPRKSEMNCPAARSVVRSTPVSMPMPSSK